MFYDPRFRPGGRYVPSIPTLRGLPEQDLVTLLDSELEARSEPARR